MCACVCSPWPGRADRPPGHVSVRLTFCCDGSGRAFFLLGPLRAGAALFLAVAVCCFFFRFVRPCCVWHSLLSGLGCLGPWHLVPPPPFFVFHFSPPRSPFFLPAFLLFFVCFGFFSFFFFFVPRCANCAVLGRFLCPGLWVCWCGLLWALCPGGGRFALALCRSVLPRRAYSLCVTLPVVVSVSGAAVLAALLFPMLPLVPLLVCFVLWSCSAAVAACRCL